MKSDFLDIINKDFYILVKMTTFSGHIYNDVFFNRSDFVDGFTFNDNLIKFLSCHVANVEFIRGNLYAKEKC